MKALVTGSAGFIGSNLVARLARRGDEVVGIDRRYTRSTDVLQLPLDIADPRCLVDIAGWAGWADVVFHLAARSGVRTRRSDIDELRRRDIVTATEHMLALTPSHTHFIVTSSSSVYGGAQRTRGGFHRPSHEEDVLRPKGGYALAKAHMEQLARGYRRFDDGLAIVRPFTVIGEGQRDDMALSMWIDATRNGDPITILGNLDRRRDVTDVRRVVDGLIAVADRRFCGIVNLGAGRPRTLAEMVEAVFVAMGRGTSLLFAPAKPEEVRATYADTTRARTQLGVDLTTDLLDATRRQADRRLGALIDS
jgi:nucleoside-diphosphate-sugar epimerase